MANHAEPSAPRFLVPERLLKNGDSGDGDGDGDGGGGLFGDGYKAMRPPGESEDAAAYALAIREHLKSACRDGAPCVCKEHGAAWEPITWLDACVVRDTGMEQRTAFTLRCAQGQCWEVYDGNADGFFCWQPDTLVSHYLLANMYTVFTSSMATLNGLYEYIEHWCLKPLGRKRKTIVDALCAYVALLKVNMVPCPICGDHPIAFICDGTGQRVRRGSFAKRPRQRLCHSLPALLHAVCVMSLHNPIPLALLRPLQVSDITDSGVTVPTAPAGARIPAAPRLPRKPGEACRKLISSPAVRAALAGYVRGGRVPLTDVIKCVDEWIRDDRCPGRGRPGRQIDGNKSPHFALKVLLLGVQAGQFSAAGEAAPAAPGAPPPPQPPEVAAAVNSAMAEAIACSEMTARAQVLASQGMDRQAAELHASAERRRAAAEAAVSAAIAAQVQAHQTTAMQQAVAQLAVEQQAPQQAPQAPAQQSRLRRKRRRTSGGGGVSPSESSPVAKVPKVLEGLLDVLSSENTSDTTLIDGEAAWAAVRKWHRGDADWRAHATQILHGAPMLAKAASDPATPAYTTQRLPPPPLAPLLARLDELWERVIGVPAAAPVVHAEGNAQVAESAARISCYPHNPAVAHRPRYDAYEDEEGRCRRSGAADDNGDPANEFSKCDSKADNVHKHGQNAYSAGIMVFTCLHGVPYGFHMMKGGESPSDVFTILLTRFSREHLPQLIIYDNGCQLYECVLFHSAAV